MKLQITSIVTDEDLTIKLVKERESLITEDKSIRQELEKTKSAFHSNHDQIVSILENPETVDVHLLSEYLSYDNLVSNLVRIVEIDQRFLEIEKCEPGLRNR